MGDGIQVEDVTYHKNLLKSWSSVLASCTWYPLGTYPLVTDFLLDPSTFPPRPKNGPEGGERFSFVRHVSHLSNFGRRAGDGRRRIGRWIWIFPPYFQERQMLRNDVVVLVEAIFLRFLLQVAEQIRRLQQLPFLLSQSIIKFNVSLPASFSPLAPAPNVSAIFPLICTLS